MSDGVKTAGGGAVREWPGRDQRLSNGPEGDFTRTGSLRQRRRTFGLQQLQVQAHRERLGSAKETIAARRLKGFVRWAAIAINRVKCAVVRKRRRAHTGGVMMWRLQAWAWRWMPSSPSIVTSVSCC